MRVIYLVKGLFIIMEILLRKLTKKSTIDFGKHSGLKVGDLLNIMEIRYLRWMYYNCSMITFFDDILEQIGIPLKWRIDKPGKNPEMNDALNDEKSGEIMYDWFQRKHYKARGKYISIGKRNSHIGYDKVTFNKAAMTRYNHGHR